MPDSKAAFLPSLSPQFETTISNRKSGSTVIFNYPKNNEPVYNLNGNLSIPLYVVDGVKVKTIETLDPADIDVINILKDSTATYIYGDSAENGVVIITTYEGAEGLSQFTDDFSFGYYLQN